LTDNGCILFNYLFFVCARISKLLLGISQLHLFFRKNVLLCSCCFLKRGLRPMGKRHIIAVRVGHPGSVGRAPDAQRGSRRTIALIMTEEGDGAWFADQTVVSGNACAGLVDRSGRILLSERLSGPVAGRPGAPADAGGARRPPAVFMEMEPLQTFPPESR
jgi:hypothetical protein